MCEAVVVIVELAERRNFERDEEGAEKEGALKDIW